MKFDRGPGLRYCSKCDKTEDTIQTFCMTCGTRLVLPPGGYEKPIWQNTWVIVGLAAVVVIVLAVIIDSAGKDSNSDVISAIEEAKERSTSQTAKQGGVEKSKRISKALWGGG